MPSITIGATSLSGGNKKGTKRRSNFRPKGKQQQQQQRRASTTAAVATAATPPKIPKESSGGNSDGGISNVEFPGKVPDTKDDTKASSSTTDAPKANVHVESQNDQLVAAASAAEALTTLKSTPDEKSGKNAGAAAQGTGTEKGATPRNGASQPNETTGNGPPTAAGLPDESAATTATTTPASGGTGSGSNVPTGGEVAPATPKPATDGDVDNARTARAQQQTQQQQQKQQQQQPQQQSPSLKKLGTKRLVAQTNSSRKRKKTGVAIGSAVGKIVPGTSGQRDSRLPSSVAEAKQRRRQQPQEEGEEEEESSSTPRGNDTDKSAKASPTSTTDVPPPLTVEEETIPPDESGAPVLAKFCTSYRVKRKKKTPEEAEAEEKEKTDKKNAKNGTSGSAGNNRSNNDNDTVNSGNTDNNNAASAGPVVQIVDGEIVLQESSMVVGGGFRRNRNSAASIDDESMPVVEEDSQLAIIGASYGSFVQRTKPKKWTVEETRLFYDALRQVGTDFVTMEAYFADPGGAGADVRKRTRKQLKRKYQIELVQNPVLVERALAPAARKDVDLTVFKVTEEDITAAAEAAAKAEAEAASRKKEEDKNALQRKEPGSGANEDAANDVVYEDENDDITNVKTAGKTSSNALSAESSKGRGVTWSEDDADGDGVQNTTDNKYDAFFDDDDAGQQDDEVHEDPIMHDDPMLMMHHEEGVSEEADVSAAAVSLVPVGAAATKSSNSKRSRPKFRTRKPGKK